jgi:hypothetical protein
VLESTRKFAPGTPVLILTGSPAESFIGDFLKHSTQVDVWGDGSRFSTITFLKKSELDRLPETLRPIVDSVRAVRDIEIRFDGPQLDLSWEEGRLIRIFVRRKGGASCTVYPLSSGLSDASVFRLAVASDQGAPLLNSLIKIGTPEMITDEVARYNKYAPRLPQEATASLIEDIRFGARRSAAVTYRLAESFTRSLFDVLRKEPNEAAAVVAKVAESIHRWHEGVPERKVTIGEIRQRFLSDDRARKVSSQFGLQWTKSLEGRSVQSRWCCIHGDLHGENVLVDRDGKPILIDYGDLGEGVFALDWVALELSSVFHPMGPARNGPWPTDVQCAKWSDDEAFARESPFESYVKACRRAAREGYAGDRELYAAAYSYLLRQLAYADTDKNRVLALLGAVRSEIESI